MNEVERMQAELIRQMTPYRRLEIARELYSTAQNIKSAGLRRQHPAWSDTQIQSRLRRIFQTGYAGD